MEDWQERKRAVLSRLRKAEGQLRGVQQLVEHEEDCEKVAQQLAAVRKALDRAFFDMMACVTQRELAAAGIGNAKTLQKLDRINQLLTRYG